MSRVREASGWAVEVDDSTGYTHRPQVVSGGGVEPARNPKANDRPAVRVPVRKSEKWRSILESGQDIDLRVWKDGVRQPIDTLEDVQQSPSATVLVGSGGRELTSRVEKSYDQKAAHLAAQDLIANETSYTANVDTPSTTAETNTQLASWASNSEFLTHLDPIPLDTDPIEVAGGDVKVNQTCFLSEGESPTRSSGTVQSDVDDYSDGWAERINDAGDYVEYDFTTSHDIPEKHVGVAIREAAVEFASITWYLDGRQIDTIDANGGELVLDWDDVGDGRYSGSGWTGGRLAAGTHTVRVEVDAATSSQYLDVDVVTLYDQRQNHNTDGGTATTAEGNWDNATDADGYLSEPALYPSVERVSFEQVPGTKAVTGARAELTVNEGASPSNGFAIRLSNDQGANFTTAANTDTLETDSLGAAFGPSVLLEVDLSHYGSRSTATPTAGFNGHAIQDVVLKADLDDMPIVVNRTFDGHIDTLLSEFADIADALWEYTRDGSTESVEWTTPGARSSSKTPQIGDYQATKTTRDEYQKAVVYGQPDVQVTGEQFESNHGVVVALSKDRLQRGTELVTDPRTGERYRREVDYVMDYQTGAITTQSSGNMDDATTYEIDYRYQAFGVHDDGTTSPDVAEPAEFPGLSNDFLCTQAARQIVNEVNTPLHTAEVTIPNDEAGWSVVESINPELVPTGGRELHIRDVQNTPEATVLTLGSRRTVGEVVSQIRGQVSAVTRKA